MIYSLTKLIFLPTNHDVVVGLQATIRQVHSCPAATYCLVLRNELVASCGIKLVIFHASACFELSFSRIENQVLLNAIQFLSQ